MLVRQDHALVFLLALISTCLSLNETIVSVENDCVYTQTFSDDLSNRGQECPGNTMVRGFWCDKSYCDEHRLLCCNVKLSNGAIAKRKNAECVWTDVVPNNYYFPQDKFLIGAHCGEAGYCTDIKYRLCPYENLFTDPSRRDPGEINYSEESTEEEDDTYVRCPGSTVPGYFDSIFRSSNLDNHIFKCYRALDISSNCHRCYQDNWAAPRVSTEEHGYLECATAKDYSATVEACKVETLRLGAHGFNFRVQTSGPRCIIKKCEGDIRLYNYKDSDRWTVYERVPNLTEDCDRSVSGCQNHNNKQCLSDNHRYECTKCLPNHKLETDKTCKSCSSPSPNCKVPIPNTCSVVVGAYYPQCRECNSGYYKDANQDCNFCDDPNPNCAKTILECSSFGHHLKCETCNPGFYVDATDKCKACDLPTPNCDPHNVVPNTCSTKGNYRLCSDCNDGFKVDANGDCKACLDDTPNCDSALKNTCSELPSIFYRQCEVCSDGFKIKDAGECKKCDGINQHCAIEFSNSCTSTIGAYHPACEFCQAGSKTFGDDCIACDQPVPNCTTPIADTCSTLGYFHQCQTCEPGYFLDDDNNCQPCDLPSLNCLTVLPNTCSDLGNFRQCAVCNAGFKLDFESGKDCTVACIDATPNCKTELENTCTELDGLSYPQCNVCDDGYKIEGTNECRICNGNNDNCEEEIANTCTSKEGFYHPVCLTCQVGYTHFHDECKICDGPSPHCTQTHEECSDNGYYLQCDECDLGYYVNDAHDCRPCNNTSPYCTETIPDTCSEKGNFRTCSTCVAGYKLDAVNDCVECDALGPHCTSNVNDTCTEREGLFYGLCASCEEGYKINATKECQRCDGISNKCAVSTDFTCSSTEGGFYPVCESCEIGWDIIDDDCRVCNETASNCRHTLLECSDNGYYLQCDECNVGFYVDDVFDCQPCNNTSPKCLEVIPDTCSKKGNFRTCSTCIPGYKPDSTGDCTKCDLLGPNCTRNIEDTCTEREGLFYGFCAACEDGFKINATSECQRCDGINNNCAVTFDFTCSATVGGYYPKCESCDIGWDLFHDDCKVCNEPALHCTHTHPECSDNGYYLQCDECDAGFYVDQALDCKPCNDTSPSCTEVIPDTCSEKGNFRTCSACIPGYKLDSVSDCVECASLGPNCTANKADTCTEREGLFYGLCAACEDGFKINASSECQRCDGINNRCTKSTDFSCSSTEGGYYPVCEICDIGWNNFNDDCKECTGTPDHCKEIQELTCDGDGFNRRCVVCEDDYYLDSNGDCQEKIYCTNECLNGGSCDITQGKCNCPSIYTGEECQLCSQGQPSCRNSNPSLECQADNMYTQCDECFPGFYLDNTTCFDLEEGCAEGTRDQCFKCFDQSAYIVGKTCLCLGGSCTDIEDCDPSPNCDVLESEVCKGHNGIIYFTRCDQCAANHYPDKNRECKRCSSPGLSNCLPDARKECTPTGYTCESGGCMDGFYNTNDQQCQECHIKGHCIADSVKECSPDGTNITCQLDRCLNGYFNSVDDYECRLYQTAEAMGNCKSVAYVSNVNGELRVICERNQCQYGYSNKNNGAFQVCTQFLSCLPTKEECKQGGDENAVCSVISGLDYECTCSDGYRFVGGTCEEIPICERGECGLANAKCTIVDDENYTCECPTSYFFDSVTCSSCPDNCRLCSEAGKCEDCTSNHFMMNESTACVTATECPPHTFADYSNSSCNECSQLCGNCYGGLETNCISCIDEYENRSVAKDGDTCYMTEGNGSSFVLSTWFWILIAICILILLILLLLLIIFFRRRRNKRKNDMTKLPEGVSAMDFVMGRTGSISVMAANGDTYADANPTSAPVSGRKFSAMLASLMRGDSTQPVDPEALEMMAKAESENSYDYNSSLFEQSYEDPTYEYESTGSHDSQNYESMDEDDPEYDYDAADERTPW